MLLQIDVYPYNASMDETDEDGIPVSPLPPLYACLKTARADGTLITVGRKDTDVVLSDKSVSRNHLTMSLVSTLETEKIFDDAKPTTPEEEAACEENDGVCLIVTDSSRFGTFLVKEGNSAKKAAEDGDATGSDTEDESQQPGAASSGVTLSPLATKLTHSKATLEKFEGRLILSDFKERVLIQCGQNGSTLLIRRVPLTLVFSGLEKSTKDLWMKRLPLLGATLLTNMDNAMTALVSNKRVSSGKHLAAWYMQKPILTTEYLQALWDRDSPDASMPKEVDCAPTIGGNEAFWKLKPKTNLLSGCTYLCLLNDDMRPLIQAAGATIIPLFDVSEKDALHRIKDMDMANTFYISTTTAKVKKLVQYLKRHDVAHVTQKALGQAVAKFLRLQDHHGNYIGPELEEEEEEEEQMDVVPDKEPLPASESVPEASKETSQSVEQDAVDASGDEKQANQNSQEKEDEMATNAASTKKRSKDSSKENTEEEEPPKQRRKTSADAGDEEEEASTKTASSRKKRSKDTANESAEDEEPPKQRRKSSKDAEEDESDTETSSRKKKRSKQASSKDDPQEEEEPPKQRRKKQVELEPVEEEKSLEVEEEEEDEEPGWNAGDEPKKLQVSNDGWFVAAPSGKKRKAYIREIDLEGEEAPPPTAGTAKSSKLVVGPRKASAATSYRATSMGRSGGKDFKKFRKNTVAKGNMSRIQLRSVLPKESEAEQELDERERALEEEQRVADALFRDPGAGGIRSHFKPKSRRKRS